MKRLVVCCDGTWNRPDLLNPFLDHLRSREPAERTRFFVIYRFGPGEARAQK